MRALFSFTQIIFLKGDNRMETNGKVKISHLFALSFWCAVGAYFGWSTARSLDRAIGRVLYDRKRRKEASHAEN